MTASKVSLSTSNSSGFKAKPSVGYGARAGTSGHSSKIAQYSYGKPVNNSQKKSESQGKRVIQHSASV
jgi:hypothetical protein